jgi:hypothetical protein
VAASASADLAPRSVRLDASRRAPIWAVAYAGPDRDGPLSSSGSERCRYGRPSWRGTGTRSVVRQRGRRLHHPPGDPLRPAADHGRSHRPDAGCPRRLGAMVGSVIPTDGGVIPAGLGVDPGLRDDRRRDRPVRRHRREGRQRRDHHSLTATLADPQRRAQPGCTTVPECPLPPVAALTLAHGQRERQRPTKRDSPRFALTLACTRRRLTRNCRISGSARTEQRVGFAQVVTGVVRWN